MTARLIRGRWHEDGIRGPELLAKKADMPKNPYLQPPKSLARCRIIAKRTLAHALASNLKNMVEATFSPHNATHGRLTITFDYPLKPTKAMPKG